MTMWTWVGRRERDRAGGFYWWSMIRGEMWRVLKMWGIGRGEKYNEENTEDQTDQNETNDGTTGCAHEGLMLEESDHNKGAKVGEEGVRRS
jgi:hypothetical protein